MAKGLLPPVHGLPDTIRELADRPGNGISRLVHVRDETLDLYARWRAIANPFVVQWWFAGSASRRDGSTPRPTRMPTMIAPTVRKTMPVTPKPAEAEPS